VNFMSQCLINLMKNLLVGRAVLAGLMVLGSFQAADAQQNMSATGATPIKSVAEVLDARSLGLVCDSKADNAKVFDLIHAKTLKTPGQTVLFPPETAFCLSSKPLEAASNTSYKAAPNTITLKPLPNNSSNPMLFQASDVSNVSVEGLSFEGQLGAAAEPNSVVTVYRSSNVVFDQVTIRNADGIAIVFSTGVSASGIRDGNFANIGSRWKYTGLKRDQYQGVAFCCGTENNNNFVIGSKFDDVGLDAISFSGQIGFKANNNNVRNAGGAVDGVVGRRLTVGVTNKGLVGGAAVYGASSHNVQVVNNVSDGAGGNGIDLFMVNNADITSNTARRSGGNGIAFAAASGGTITRNVAIDNNQARGSVVSAPQAGIFLTGGRNGQPSVRQVTISGNVVTDDQLQKTQNYGIQLQDGATATDINVDQTNRLNGNAMGEFGEGFARNKPAAVGTR
jgi:parallel beta-helix repeat protein